MSPRTRSVDKDRQILDAAIELFADNGFTGVTVAEVAARAGVGLNTLYLRFPSKDALGSAALRRCRLAFAAATLDNLPESEPAEVQFQAYWSRLYTFARREPGKARYGERRPIGHQLDAQTSALIDEVHRRSTEMLHRVAGGPVDASVIAALVHGTFWRVFELPLPHRRRAVLLREAGDLVWRAIASTAR